LTSWYTAKKKPTWVIKKSKGGKKTVRKIKLSHRVGSQLQSTISPEKEKKSKRREKRKEAT